MITKRELNKLRRSLPHGAFVELIKRLKKKGYKIKYQSVVNVFQGRCYHEYIINEAIAYAKEVQEKQQATDEKISKQINTIAA